MADALYSGYRLAMDIQAGPAFAMLQQAFLRMPRQAERAQSRALRKLKTWLQRQVLKAGSAATGIPQKFLSPRAKGGARWYATLTKTGLEIWLGTSPMPVHRTGVVRWTRRMKGARVGRRSYPGAWSWGPGSKTGPSVMERTGSSRLPISRVEEEIHDPIVARLRSLTSEAGERFEKLLAHELDYALNLEGVR